MRSIITYVVGIAILGALACLGVLTDHKSFVGSLFAAFVSIAVIVFVEAELRPQISIVQEKTPKDIPGGRRFLRVLVENRALWWPLNLVMDRRPAYQTRARVTFLTDKNDRIFAPERVMIGRWSNTPEPSRPISISSTPDQPPAIAILWDLSLTRDAIDIGSGSVECLDIVARDPGEDGCRGWHNRMISRPNVPPEDRFELSSGCYHALVEVDTSGRSIKALFRIVCDVPIGDFRLETLSEVPRGL